MDQAFDATEGEDWDENDWERFFQRSDTRAAKFQELFETLLHHPNRDKIIAREMRWDRSPKDCGKGRNCSDCDEHFDCEAYEMSQLLSEPVDVENDPDVDEMLASFEAVREIPAYEQAQAFAERLEKAFREHVADWQNNEQAAAAYISAHMVAAKIAGGHGIGYERDSLCGNIANCKRALRNVQSCIEQIGDLQDQGILPAGQVERLRAEAEDVEDGLSRWIESLRARIWWR